MSLYYFGVILFFAVGAGIGGVLSVHLGFHAIWISSGLLLISFLLMFKDRLEKDVHELEGDLEEDIQKLGTQLIYGTWRVTYYVCRTSNKRADEPDPVVL